MFAPDLSLSLGILGNFSLIHQWAPSHEMLPGGNCCDDNDRVGGLIFGNSKSSDRVLVGLVGSIFSINFKHFHFWLNALQLVEVRTICRMKVAEWCAHSCHLLTLVADR